MGSHKAFVGNLTIANGGTDSNVLSNRQLAMARKLIFHNPATFTAAVTLRGNPKAGVAFSDTQPVRVGAADIALVAAKMQEVDAGGFESIAVVSAGAEGAERVIPVYAVLEI
jgi:hypothetical protein